VLHVRPLEEDQAGLELLLVGDELAAVGAIAAPFLQDLYRG
jgi:hypothetical protein